MLPTYNNVHGINEVILSTPFFFDFLLLELALLNEVSNFKKNIKRSLLDNLSETKA